MTDELRDRLRAADPADRRRTSPSSPTPIRELMEQTMQITDEQITDTSNDRRRNPWLVAAAAVTLLALGGAGVAGVLSRAEPDSPVASKPSVVLALPDSNAMSSCMVFSVEVLAGMPTAFSGTVISAEKDAVQLRVDTWYRGDNGGEGDTVALRNPQNAMTSIDGVVFAEDKRYLVTANETGTVNTCGYTVAWSAEMAADFEAAFSR